MTLRVRAMSFPRVPVWNHTMASHPHAGIGELRPKPAQCLCLQIKFYWHAATSLVCTLWPLWLSHYGAESLKIQDYGTALKTRACISWPCAEKVCQSLLWSPWSLLCPKVKPVFLLP